MIGEHLIGEPWSRSFNCIAFVTTALGLSIPTGMWSWLSNDRIFVPETGAVVVWGHEDVDVWIPMHVGIVVGGSSLVTVVHNGGNHPTDKDPHVRLFTAQYNPANLWPMRLYLP